MIGALKTYVEYKESGSGWIEPVEDIRGRKDLFGKPLLITRRTTADNLVSAAQVIMGEADESTPAVFIRDAPAVFIGARISPDSEGEFN